MLILKRIIKEGIYLPMRFMIRFLFLYERGIEKILPNLARRARESMIKVIDADVREVIHQSQSKTTRFLLHTPNQTCAFRHETFSSKEPELLELIDEYGGDGAFYDVGANIGIYSIYYAKNNNGNVYSFEPSVFNLRQLAKNIMINNLENQINIISNPLSGKSGFAAFRSGGTNEGGALSSFGVEYGHDGKTLNSDFEYRIIGFTLDDLIKQKVIIEPPRLMKIDVDGIEHLILSGAKNTLASKSLKSIIIEVNDNFEEQSHKVRTILESASFSLRDKRHASLSSESKRFGKTYNQIWIRKY